MKRLLVLPILLTIAVTFWAIPVRRGQYTIITLTDGTQVRAELCGDERLDYMRGEDGSVYTRIGDTQTYQLSNLASLREQVKEVRATDARRRAMRAPMLNAGRQAAYTGKKRGLIILVEFKDLAFQTAHTKEFYERMANEVGFTHSEGYHGSVHDYFLEQSYGQFDLTFDVVGPYKLTKNYSYYGGNSPWKDYNVSTMIREAVDAAKNDANWTDYDWDGDNLVDQVFILYAGDCEAWTGSDPNTVWPHESAISARYMNNGKYVSTYACASELFATAPGGIGTVCHEFTHCLGILDMYDTDYESTNGEGYGMGLWDVMASGGDLDGGMTPAGYTSYERWISGWLTPIELTGQQDITGMKALSDGGEAYVIYNQGRGVKSDKGEYYLLENRQHVGWDAALPGTGLLITHVDYDATAWKGNNINSDYNHQRCEVVRARNKSTMNLINEIAGDIYPFLGNDRLTNDTKPAATLYNKNTDGSYFLNYPITTIEEKDGLISFAAGYEADKGDLNGPDVDPTDALFYESFDQCAGIGANDRVWADDGMGSATFVSDISGWNASAKSGADRCALFGSKSKSGTAITPSIEIDGEATLYFHAAPWQAENCTITLSATNGINLSENSLALKPGKWVPMVVTLTGTGKTRITFKPSQRRWFLDEVIVKANGSTGIQEIPATPLKNEERIYTLEGQYVGKSISSLPKGIYIMNGKKILK